MSFLIAHKERDLSLEYMRFFFRLIFSVVIILLLSLTGFFVSLTVLLFLLVLGSVFFKSFAKKEYCWVKYLLRFEKSYEAGFAGKRFLLSLLAVITSFVVVGAVNYILILPAGTIEWALILGFVAMGIGNNLVSLVLFLKDKHYCIYGSTLEFFILAGLFNLFLFWLLGVPLIVAGFITFSLQIVLIIPWLDYNLVTPLVTAVLYLLLFL